MDVTRVFIFGSDQGSGLLPIHRANKGICQTNVLHAWNKIAHKVGTLLVRIIIIIVSHPSNKVGDEVC